MRNLIAAIALGLWALVPLATSASAANRPASSSSVAASRRPAPLGSHLLPDHRRRQLQLRHRKQPPPGLADLTAFNFSVCFFVPVGRRSSPSVLADLQSLHLRWQHARLHDRLCEPKRRQAARSFRSRSCRRRARDRSNSSASSPPRRQARRFNRSDFSRSRTSSVPEPGIWGFMILSFTVLAFSRRRLLARAASPMRVAFAPSVQSRAQSKRTPASAWTLLEARGLGASR